MRSVNYPLYVIWAVFALLMLINVALTLLPAPR